MTKIKIIADDATLSQVCGELQTSQWIALDTEFMREKTFSPILCLIQVCSGQESFCIDPLRIENLEPFHDLLANQSIEKILHSCRQDFEAFDTRFQLVFKNLIDTQIAASFCGGDAQLSYAAVVEQVTGVKLAKSHTRANWQARPLSTEELQYAIDDVVYLQDVREYFWRKLKQLNRLTWFQDECANQTQSVSWRTNPEDAWLRLKGAARLESVAHGVARKLAVWRETEAIARNLPREWIVDSRTLLEVSRLNPDSTSALQRIEGINSGIVRKFGDHILQICRDTPRHDDAKPLWSSPRMLDSEQKKKVKGIMTLLNQTSQDLGISGSLIANRNSVEKFVAGITDLELFRGWRRQIVGEKILQNYS